MSDLSGLSNAIRLPFELIGTVLNFFLKYFIHISIVVASVWFVYWLFSKGIIERMSNAILDELEERKNKRDDKNGTN